VQDNVEELREGRSDAQIAIYAAKNTCKGEHWGFFAAKRYCQRRGVSEHRFVTALGLEIENES
jgi:hypothetical protein